MAFFPRLSAKGAFRKSAHLSASKAYRLPTQLKAFNSQEAKNKGCVKGEPPHGPKWWFTCGFPLKQAGEKAPEAVQNGFCLAHPIFHTSKRTKSLRDLRKGLRIALEHPVGQHISDLLLKIILRGASALGGFMTRWWLRRDASRTCFLPTTFGLRGVGVLVGR